jgi:hypothetical protein
MTTSLSEWKLISTTLLGAVGNSSKQWGSMLITAKARSARMLAGVRKRYTPRRW